MKKILFVLIVMTCLHLPAQIISTIAGIGGTGGSSGDGGQATAAIIKDPSGVSFDKLGNLYITDYYNNRIRKVTTAGIISTVAGNGSNGFYGDGGQAIAATLYYPAGGVVFDKTGNMFIADYENQRVRKVNTAGIITTVAGGGGSTANGAQGTAAFLDYPAGLAFDASGNLFIAEYGLGIVRKLTTAGIITTVAGNSTGGSLSDGIPATNASLNSPDRVSFDVAGNLYISDYNVSKIRMVNTAGIISTFAGTGTGGYTGDGGQATAAEINNANGTAFDAVGNFYICDYSNNRVRKVTTAGIITTVAGSTYGGYSGDGGPATAAELSQPAGVAFDATGNMYISDLANQCIRKVSCPVPTLTLSSGSYTICSGTTQTLSVSGAVSYTWTPVTSLNNIYSATPNASPTTTTVYSVVGTNSVGCSNVLTPNTVTITVNLAPVISINPPTICIGATTTLTASGATSYTWNTTETTATISPSPTVTTHYTVTATDINNCVASDTAKITVNPLPVISINSPSICIGATATLTASGATSYTWNTTATTASISATPTVTTHYTVTATDINNCVASDTAKITVNPLPVISINSATLCAGATATLTASGANTYTWNTTATTASISGTPTVTTHYTVTATDVNNCVASDTAEITVNPLPVISINSTTLCAGTTATLTASGANIYTWNTTATTASISATPSVTTHYTVTATDINNCVASDTAKITVNPLPILSISSNTTNICAGTSTTLTASGASTYTWVAGPVAAVYTVTPSVKTTYTVMGTDGNSCMNTDTLTIQITNCNTGIDFVVNSNAQFILYPNPGDGRFIIGSENALSDLKVMIYDVNGREIYNQLSNTNQLIDLGSLPGGIYQVRIQNREGLASKKLVIVK